MPQETQPISRPLVALPALWGQQPDQQLLGFPLTETGEEGGCPVGTGPFAPGYILHS